MSLLFTDFAKRAAKDKIFEPLPRVIALDPGETTGYAYFESGILKEAKQLETHTVHKGCGILHPILKWIKPDIVVYEDYKVYAWKTTDHAWNTLHTPRFIGAIQTLCWLEDIETYHQMAQQPKGFVTDDKLKMWGMYQKGQRHARDAMRHGCYYMLFNSKKDSTEEDR